MTDKEIIKQLRLQLEEANKQNWKEDFESARKSLIKAWARIDELEARLKSEEK